MKLTFKLFSIFFILNACAVCFAAPEPTARLYNYSVKKNVYLAEKLAKGKTITYCAYLSEDGLKMTSREDFEDYVKLVFKLWTAYPASLIRAAGREKEFAPVLKMLETGPKLKRLENCDFSQYPKKYFKYLNPKPGSFSAERADISFFYENVFFAKMNGLEKIPPHYTYSPAPRVVIPARFNASYSTSHFDAEAFRDIRGSIIETPGGDYAAIAAALKRLETFLRQSRDASQSLLYALLHETGHAIGLADQLKSALDNADIFYGTVKPRKSVMDNYTTSQTCDDADGVIMLFDDALGIKRKDFKSLCEDGVKFDEGKECFEGEKTNAYDSGCNSMSRTYFSDTKDTGVYRFESSVYVNTGSKESRKIIESNFDIKAMPKNLGGFMKKKGKMRVLDLNDPENRVPVGEYTAVITLGPMAMHKQVLTEQYDNNGNLLYYTLKIYKEGQLVKTKTKIFGDKKAEIKFPQD